MNYNAVNVPRARLVANPKAKLRELGVERPLDA